MDNLQAIKELGAIREQYETLLDKLDRKRWRESEKVMTGALYRRRIQALDTATTARSSVAEG